MFCLLEKEVSYFCKHLVSDMPMSNIKSQKLFTWHLLHRNKMFPGAVLAAEARKEIGRKKNEIIFSSVEDIV